MDYKGYIEVQLDDNKLAAFYNNKDLYAELYGLKENEYLLIKDLTEEIVDKYCYQDGELRQVKYNIIQNAYCGKIKPRNLQQELAMDMLIDKHSKIKLVQGVYGSGKDYLMLNQALSLIEKGKFQKIVFIRPNVTVANVPEIGYLKGTTEEKLAWTLGPFYDKVGGEEGVRMLVEQGKIELVPLLFIRGRSFDNSIVYVTEGQNITAEIAKLIISRIGDNSELWLNCDTHQVDKQIYEKDNGVNKMGDRLAGNSLFAYIYLPKTERSQVAELATLLDD